MPKRMTERRENYREDCAPSIKTQCRSDKCASTLNRVKISLMCAHSKQSVDQE